MSREALLERIIAALRAAAAGDAMGRATEHYRPHEIIEVYEGPISEFVEPVRLFDDEEWAAGEVGPPTRIVLAFAGSPDQAPWPAGAMSVDRLPAALSIGLRCTTAGLPLTEGVESPHLAVAAGLAAALDGFTVRDVVQQACTTAASAGDDALAGAIARAAALAETSGGRHAGEALASAFPPDGDVGALVPFIFGIVYATQSARRAIVEAVNQGGHAPETAAIAGAICAAAIPGTLPAAWGLEVVRINGLDIDSAARRYLAARTATS